MRLASILTTLAILVVAPAAAVAQPAFALGKPLPDANLPAGTVIVRVIAGDATKAVATTEVTMVVNGTSRVARTDAEGRATFQGLAIGGQAQASIVGEDEKQVTSDQFPVPGEGGARVMLSTKPMSASSMGMGGGMGGQGMPEPRRISGVGRPDSADPPGMLTVRLTYDDFAAQGTDLDKHPVILVGYTDENKVTVKKALTDAAGRAEFKGLDTTGRTAYYAMTLMARGNTIDRLVSQPIQLLPGLGTRMVLSAAKRTSNEAAIDDYDQLVSGYPAIQPGTITAEIQTPEPDDGGTVELVEAASDKVIASQPVGPSADPTSSVTAKFSPPQTNPRVPKGMIAVVAGSATGEPLDEATLELIPAEGNAAAPAKSKTQDDGFAGFNNVAPGRYTMKITVDGRSGMSDPFDVADAPNGALIQALFASFDGIPTRHVQIDNIPPVTEPVYIRLRSKGQTLMGIPFLVSPGAGMFERFYLGDRLFMSFVLHGSVDDKYYAVNGQFTLYNTWWAPYRAGEDGLLVSLPHGFTGGVVGDDDKTRVAPDPGYGFRIRRPLAPGTLQFDAGFSLPIVNGVATWNMDLPWGAESSTINLLDAPGMKVDFPAGARSRYRRGQNGSLWLSIDKIDIGRGQSLQMSVRGLPVPPAWKTWTPRIVGLLVVVLLCATVWLAVRARTQPSGVRAAASAKIQSLMDELVELEKQGQGGKRKDQILAELEKLWDADARTERVG